jgi:hypothetical protein
LFIFNIRAVKGVKHCDNIYDKIQELLGCIPGNVSILEEQIDADVQLEYYNHTQKLKDTFSPDDVLKDKDNLFHPGMALEEKKDLLVKLASIDSIEAYRTLEKYTSGSFKQLKDWAILAMQECRLLLESKLLDSSQVLISTGLGGKGLKLRYFTVLVARENIPYNTFQQKIVTEETMFAMKKGKGELEDLQFDQELCTILSIIPLQIPVQRLFDEMIRECNHYGDFIHPRYIITNVKILEHDEIRRIILKKTKPGKINSGS